MGEPAGFVGKKGSGRLDIKVQHQAKSEVSFGWSYFELPFPCVTHGLVDVSICFPSEHLIGFRRVGPDFFDVTFTPRSDGIWNFYTSGAFERLYELHYAQSASGAEIEYFQGGGVISVEHAAHCNDVCSGQIDDINEVADAGSVGSVIVIAEYGEKRAYACSCLGEIWNKVLRHSYGEFADFSRGMCPDWIEVSEQYAFDGRACVDYI